MNNHGDSLFHLVVRAYGGFSDRELAYGYKRIRNNHDMRALDRITILMAIAHMLKERGLNVPDV